MNKLPIHRHDFARDRWSWRRYQFTLVFMKRHIPQGKVVFDLGTINGLSIFMKENGYKVFNTIGEDFDLEMPYQLMDADVTTAFEIIEHLMNPLLLLRALKTKKLLASVPLRLWFAPAFRHPDNPAGRHFHEFEQWQMDWLLEKAGWKIIAREKHTGPTFQIGIRSILRWITPRYYLIYAEREGQCKSI